MKNLMVSELPHKNIVLEICELGNLEKYNDVVTSLCDVIEHNGCRISCHTVNMPSVMQFEEQPLIRLALKGKEKPIHIIWDLIHEYGHYLSGAPKQDDIELEREIIAWEHARKMLLKHPKLMPFLLDFKAYKHKCLDSYKSTLKE